MASDHLRPVGLLEKLYTARNSLGLYHSIIVTGTYEVSKSLDGKDLEGALAAALSRVILRHPALSLCIVDENSNEPVFRHARFIDLRKVLEFDYDLVSDDSLVQCLQRLHDQPWTQLDSIPPWKLVVLHHEPTISAADQNASTLLNLALVYHHVIADGLSGAAFHKSLLRELRHQSWEGLGLQDDVFQLPQESKLIGPIETLIKFPLSWTFLLKQVIQEYGPRFLSGRANDHFAGTDCELSAARPFASRLRLLQIEFKHVKTLSDLCKAHGVSMTSFLTAALVISITAALPNATSFIGMTPYTLRRLMHTDMDEMVNQTSGLEIIYKNPIAKPQDLRNDRLWKVARHHQSHMNAELSKCPYDNLVGLLPYISDHRAFYSKKLDRKRETTFEVSNLGVVKVKSDPGRNGVSDEDDGAIWKLEKVTFTQGAQVVGPALALNCASVEDGPLVLSFTWQERVVEEAVMDRVFEEFERICHVLASTI